MPVKTPSRRTRAVPASPRDRDATRERLLEAAARLVAEAGFAGLGVNPLAAAAGVDKQLIYRYFGGLDGVVKALGERVEFWLGAAEAVAPGRDYADSVRGLLGRYGEALRGNDLLLAFLQAELAQASPLLNALETTRSKAMQSWMARIRPQLDHPPEGVDAPAINAVILAGLHHLALRERSVGRFAGLDLREPATWDRIGRAIDRLVDGTLRTASSPSTSRTSR
jgi:AcrR family transcriptional regulator